MNQIFDPFNKWFADLDEVEMVAIEQEKRKKARQSTYLHCWCVGNADYDLMWKAYIKDPPGVAIKSSVKRLIKLCDDAMSHGRLDITMVTYFDHAGGQRIDYFGKPATFFYKDRHFKLENELRLVHWPNYTTPPDHTEIPISPNDLIERVVLQPKAKKDSLKFVRELLDKSNFQEIPIEFSRDDRELME